MSEGIDKVQAAVDHVVGVVNHLSKLKETDLKACLVEALDLDEAEGQRLSESVAKLDLSDDQVEALVKQYFGDGMKYAPTLLRLVKVFFPKKA